MGSSVATFPGVSVSSLVYFCLHCFPIDWCRFESWWLSISFHATWRSRIYGSTELTLRWFFKWSLRVKLFWQYGHMCFFSPWCINSWRISLNLDENAFSQSFAVHLKKLLCRKYKNYMVDLVYGSVVVETTCDILGRFRCTLCEHFYATSDVKTKLASMENFTSHVM